MSYLSKLQKKVNLNGDNSKLIVILDLALREELESLEKGLKNYPNIFFHIPGVAPKADKQAKSEAIRELLTRINLVDVKTTSDFSTFPDSTLDGNTLELFKLATIIMPKKFSDTEIQSISNRDPGLRIFRKN